MKFFKNFFTLANRFHNYFNLNRHYLLDKSSFIFLQLTLEEILEQAEALLKITQQNDLFGILQEN